MIPANVPNQKGVQLTSMSEGLSTNRKHSKVLQRIMGYLKKYLDSHDKREMVEVIDQYRQEFLTPGSTDYSVATSLKQTSSSRMGQAANLSEPRSPGDHVAKPRLIPRLNPMTALASTNANTARLR